MVRTRESEPELFGRIQMSYIEAAADYKTTSEEVALPTDETHAADKFRKRLGKYLQKNGGMEHSRMASVKTMRQGLSPTQP